MISIIHDQQSFIYKINYNIDLIINASIIKSIIQSIYDYMIINKYHRYLISQIFRIQEFRNSGNFGSRKPQIPQVGAF